MPAYSSAIRTKVWTHDDAPFAWSAVVKLDPKLAIKLFLVRDAGAIRDMRHSTVADYLRGTVLPPTWNSAPAVITTPEYQAYMRWYQGDDREDPLPMVRRVRANDEDAYLPFVHPGWFVYVVTLHFPGAPYTELWQPELGYGVVDGKLVLASRQPAHYTDAARAAHQAMFDAIVDTHFTGWPQAKSPKATKRAVKVGRYKPTNFRPWHETRATYEPTDTTRWIVEIRRYVQDGRILVGVWRDERDSRYARYDSDRQHGLDRVAHFYADLRDDRLVPRPPREHDRYYLDPDKLDLTEAIMMQQTFAAALAELRREA